MANQEPIIVPTSEGAWETWADMGVTVAGLIRWKTLISRDKTASDSLTMGLAELLPF